MKRILLMVCIVFGVAAPALAQIGNFSKPIVAGVSTRIINMHASFNGISLLFYGAKNAPGEVVIVLRGPKNDAMLRRKERIAGMWMVAEQTRYKSIPAFYRIASTRPLTETLTDNEALELGIGKEGLLREIHATHAPNPTMDNALISELQRMQRIKLNPSPIDYFAESLFSVPLALPDNMPHGTYVAEIFLMQEGRIVSSQAIPILARKAGVDAWLSGAAHNKPWLYGLASVILALLGGWLGNRLLGR